ncbi:MAG: 3-keto-5-aminohexanoate cleavage protein [Dermatophilaceae bacterium]
MAAPRAPGDMAAQARAAVDAGARSLHLHPYDEDGRQTFAAGPCAATLRAVRAACPGIPISLSTSADVEPDPRRRIALVEAWSELPDLVTANQGEDGIVELRRNHRSSQAPACAGRIRVADSSAKMADS